VSPHTLHLRHQRNHSRNLQNPKSQNLCNWIQQSLRPITKANREFVVLACHLRFSSILRSQIKVVGAGFSPIKRRKFAMVGWRREGKRNMARGKWVFSYKKTTLLVCFFNIAVALYVLRSLYASLYIYSGNVSRNGKLLASNFFLFTIMETVAAWVLMFVSFCSCFV